MTIEKEKQHLLYGFWAAAKKCAEDQYKWRELVNGPILHMYSGK
jgi:hypothetical protein